VVVGGGGEHTSLHGTGVADMSENMLSTARIDGIERYIFAGYVGFGLLFSFSDLSSRKWIVLCIYQAPLARKTGE
jgi:hypothetical protein